jgi:hypothetical protein
MDSFYFISPRFASLARSKKKMESLIKLEEVREQRTRLACQRRQTLIFSWHASVK